MMLFRWIPLALVAVAVSLNAGCGQGSSSAGKPSPPPDVSSTEELKSRLKNISESGNAGSALAGMNTAIEAVPDAAKKTALQQDYRKLEQATSPGAIKQIAKGMLNKLER